MFKQQQKQQEKVVLHSQPELAEGLNLVKKPEDIPVFQMLTASELEGYSQKAVWIDTKNESSTYALSQYGDLNIMENVEIGRAFTAFQHHSLIQQLEEFVDKNTRLLVVPNISYLYVEGQLSDWEAEELFQETWEKLKEVQEKYELKVLLSADLAPQIPYYVSSDCVNEIKVERKSEGLKYDSENFDQMIYRKNGEVQTTMRYWEKQKIRVEAEVTHHG